MWAYQGARTPKSEGVTAAFSAPPHSAGPSVPHASLLRLCLPGPFLWMIQQCGAGGCCFTTLSHMQDASPWGSSACSNYLPFLFRSWAPCILPSPKGMEMPPWVLTSLPLTPHKAWVPGFISRLQAPRATRSGVAHTPATPALPHTPLLHQFQCSPSVSGSGSPFDASATQPGLHIWRVEKMKPVPVPKEMQGVFYSGDSYLVLHNGEDEQSHLHLWIGELPLAVSPCTLLPCCRGARAPVLLLPRHPHPPIHSSRVVWFCMEGLWLKLQGLQCPHHLLPGMGLCQLPGLQLELLEGIREPASLAWRYHYPMLQILRGTWQGGGTPFQS